MLVLRVENPSGVGPYNGERWNIELPYTEWHVTPMKDKGIDRYPEPDEFCGFTGMSQLKQWFAGYFKGLHESDYRLSLYRCPKESVTIGEKQVIFNRSDAKKVREFSLSMFRD